MEHPVTGGDTPTIKTENRHVPRPASQAGRLWLAIVLLLLMIAGLHRLHHHELQGLQHQLVATQDSFAGLGEESLSQLQQLDERTAGLTALQGRVQGVLLELEHVQRQLQDVSGATAAVHALQAGQEQLKKLLPGFSQQLEEQSRAVEQAALILDKAQQKLQARQERQEQLMAEQDEALSALALELTASMQEWQALDQQQKEDQAAQQAALEQELARLRKQLQSVVEDPRYAELQQSVLKLAQRMEGERQRQQQLEEDMTAFRLQVTRAQERIQQRLDALQP